MTKEQLGDLILRSEDQMYHIAKSILRQDTDCADAIQEAIAKAFENLSTLRRDSYARTWLIRIVINESYAILRKQSRCIYSTDDADVWPGDLSDGKTSAPLDYSDLYNAIMELPATDRVVLVLYYFEGYRIREIAKILELSESSIKNRLFRARKQLQARLKETEDPSPSKANRTGEKQLQTRLKETEAKNEKNK